MIQPVILAAGKGTRMRSELPKVLIEISGKPLLSWILDALRGTKSYEAPIIVVNPDVKEVVRSCVGTEPQLIVQENPSGTASGVSICMDELKKRGDPVLVLYGDHPFIKSKSLEAIAELFLRERPTLALFTTTVPDFEGWRKAFWHFGKIVRASDGSLSEIVEYKNAKEEQRGILELNPAVYCIDLKWLESALPRVTPNSVTGEYYLTDLIFIAKLENRKVLTCALSPEESLGLNSPEDVTLAETAFGEKEGVA